MHKELGFGPRFVDRENRVAYPTLANLAIRRRAQFELLAEEMRVFYVALTRPKEKMILVGFVKDAAKKAVAWSQVKDSPELVLPDYLLAAGRSYLDWIGPSLIRHRDAGLLRELAGSNDSFVLLVSWKMNPGGPFPSSLPMRHPEKFLCIQRLGKKTG